VLVTAFNVTPFVEEIDLRGLLRTRLRRRQHQLPAAPAGAELLLSIARRATDDGAVTRSLRSRVRVRNDAVVGSCQE
jgi:hypothetical protein